MKRFTTFACLALALIFALNAYAVDSKQRVMGHDSVFHGGSTSFAKDVCDSIYLIGPWGSGAAVNGEFQDASGAPAWNGWETVDYFAKVDEIHWHVSEYGGGINGSPALYCGDETIPACSENDVEGGYGNDWADILEFRYAVADNEEDCSVSFQGIANINTEVDFDFVYFRFIVGSEEDVVEGLEFSGVYENEVVRINHTYTPSDYTGANNDEIVVQVVFVSDGAVSDEDCEIETDGAVRLDDLRVIATNGGLNYTENFDDGTMGQWAVASSPGVGNFGRLWQNLEDIDPCFTNYTPQVAFINDGTIIPGVPASYCTNWCYGPGSYIVNTTGGASPETDAYLFNGLESPVVDWPADPAYIGCNLDFGVYRHEDLTDDSPGIFYTWSIRSATPEDDITQATWVDRNFVYYGGPDYIRGGEVVSDLLVPGLDRIQVQLTAYEYGWRWGWEGDDGYPAPYFDNVRLIAFCQEGPGISAREIDLANDGWPAIQQLDLNNLEANAVRFDMARTNEVLDTDVHNTPGDSIVVDVASIRSGGEIISNRLVYTMQRNPLFDSVRDPAWGVSGSVDARISFSPTDSTTGDTWAYDLPDSGFLFPGDILHYYIEATDAVDGANPQTATLPNDLTGYGDFSHPLAYNSSYTVRALPTVDAEGNTPEILFWNDFANRGGENEWFGALDNIGLIAGVHYDVYYTNGPSSGVGNGLGGRSSVELLTNYDHLLYTSGNLGSFTLSDGSEDHGNDLGLLADWLENFSVNAFFTGDDFVFDLAENTGGSANNFIQDYLGVAHDFQSILNRIDSQTTPLVLPVANNSVFSVTPGWVAYGGCNGINTFDAVTALPGAERLARFTTTSGVPSYDYSAATLNVTEAQGNKVITLPYDLMFVNTDHDLNPGDGRPARALLLQEVLNFFGLDDPTWVPSPVPSVGKFYAKNYPNPFNPTTKIEFNMPKAGHLTLKVYNVRGELVKTLIDEEREAGADHIMWDGTNQQGSPVSSGVYFYEARSAGEVSVNKMALVK